MEYFDKEYCLEVWGDYACFTRPELKVERVSYDVITPSAARAIFESIFWKPAIRWQVTKIEVLNNIQWTSIRRNEVGKYASPGLNIYIEENRQQRNSLLLKDVRYRIYAKLIFIPQQKRREENLFSKNPDIDKEEETLIRKDENPGKYQAMFERRASKGQCFNQPYLGTREFTASFKLIKDNDPKDSPINETKDLGIMLYDMDYSDIKDPQAMFFRASMNDGVIIVPDINDKNILR